MDLSWTSVHDRKTDNFLVVTGYTDPAVEGSSVNLTCSSGVITGPTMTTCMQNGEWEPDPTKVICEGEHFVEWSLNGNFKLIWLCHRLSDSCGIVISGCWE